MLPDFIEFKKLFNKKYNEEIKKIQIGSLMEEISHYRYFEGDKSLTLGESTPHTYSKVESKFEIVFQDVIEKGPEYFLEQAKKSGEELHNQKMRLLIQELEKVTDKTSNKISAKGEGLTPMKYFEALERIDLKFDDDGNPSTLALLMHTNQEKDAYNLQKALKEDETLKKTIDIIIDKKRKEWNDRENNRKLVG